LARCVSYRQFGVSRNFLAPRRLPAIPVPVFFAHSYRLSLPARCLSFVRRRVFLSRAPRRFLLNRLILPLLNLDILTPLTPLSLFRALPLLSVSCRLRLSPTRRAGVHLTRTRFSTLTLSFSARLTFATPNRLPFCCFASRRSFCGLPFHSSSALTFNRYLRLFVPFLPRAFLGTFPFWVPRISRTFLSILSASFALNCHSFVSLAGEPTEHCMNWLPLWNLGLVSASARFRTFLYGITTRCYLLLC